eukprot:TRINITY_DN9798_c0_g1_i1.p2 TRINITY_DN9798_c0_g1~~TRINITY_DN9798_c0_g1_i1.p2  ORF type:complete len:112 (+),score=2.16 TRINITY_DN9798_c0_g1_i1:140-475(+)
MVVFCPNLLSAALFRFLSARSVLLLRCSYLCLQCLPLVRACVVFFCPILPLAERRAGPQVPVHHTRALLLDSLPGRAGAAGNACQPAYTLRNVRMFECTITIYMPPPPACL